MNEQLNELPGTGAGQTEQPVLTSLRKFRADLTVSPSTPWRWIKSGWLDQPLNIGGRLYLTREMIEKFKRRAAAGEFARSVCPARKRGAE